MVRARLAAFRLLRGAHVLAASCGPGSADLVLQSRRDGPTFDASGLLVQLREHSHLPIHLSPLVPTARNLVPISVAYVQVETSTDARPPGPFGRNRFSRHN